MLMQARQMVLPHIIQDGISGMTDPSTRLRIYESMTRQQEVLVDKVRSLDHQIDPTLFNGPELEVKQSRFASPTVDVTKKDGEFIVRFKENEIIDVHVDPGEEHPEQVP